MDTSIAMRSGEPQLLPAGESGRPGDTTILLRFLARNLESSQTRGVCMDFLNHREEVMVVFKQVFLLSFHSVQ